MNALHKGRQSIVCDRELSYRQLMSYFEYWRLHRDGIESIQLKCDSSPTNACFCIDIPDEWYEGVLCQKDTFVTSKCDKIVLRKEILSLLPNLMFLLISGLDLSEQDANVLDEIVNLRSLHLMETSLMVHQLPKWCNFPHLDSVKLSGVMINNLADVLVHCRNNSNDSTSLSNLVELELNMAGIIDIPGEGICPDCVNLVNLSISGNRISVLSDQTLSGLGSLHKIDLSFNCLTYLPPLIFVHAKQIKNIIISNNQIFILDIAVFRFLNNLTSLDISFNHIIMIEGSLNTLPNIHEVLLSGNNLTTLRSANFQNTPRLETIDVSNNLIDTIDEEAFRGTHLIHLNLSHNKIFQVLDPIMHFNTLSWQSDQGPCPCYEWLGMVESNPHMTWLDISHNEITSIMPGSFVNLCIQNNSYPLLPLPQIWLYIDLGYNKIQNVDMAAFNCLRLIALVMDNYNISLVMASEPLQLVIRGIILANNPLKYVQPGILDTVFNYKYRNTSTNYPTGSTMFDGCLNLAGTNIYHQKNNTWDSWNDDSFNSTHDLLTRPQWLNKDLLSDNIYRLILDDNMITDEMLHDAFSIPSTNTLHENVFVWEIGFRDVYLSGNLIESVHRPWPKPLFNLGLSHNPIKLSTLKEEALIHTPYEAINMQSCGLTEILPVTIVAFEGVGLLDLKYNQISEIYEVYPQLHGNLFIELDGNPLQCNCRMRWLKHRTNTHPFYIFKICLF